MGPWEYLGIFEYPDLETAFRALGKIAKLDMFETETFPAEAVKEFGKALVEPLPSSPEQNGGRPRGGLRLVIRVRPRPRVNSLRQPQTSSASRRFGQPVVRAGGRRVFCIRDAAAPRFNRC